MFEHKHLDGQWNRVVPSGDGFLAGDVLECRDNTSGEPDGSARKQYGVVGELLVERSLPPERVGDTWAYDSVALPWWVRVMNPPHMGVVAEFNTFNGGLHRKVLDKAHNVVAFAGAGEEVLFGAEGYSVVRQSDSEQLSAPTLEALRKVYYA